jgi:hypothetical protein
MGKIIMFLVLGIFLTSFASAEIIMNIQPNQVYNLGETISIPVTIKSLTEVSNVFDMNLICSGNEINFYKNGVALSAGQEKRMDTSLILSNSMIGESKGKCVIKAILGDQYVLTNEFTISDLINVNVNIKNPAINPGESITIDGSAIKESNNQVNGFIQINIYPKNYNIDTQPIVSQLETINNGFFKSNITTPEDLAAKNYTIAFHAYEKDPSGEITNQGGQSTEFSVNQVPKNLEIIIENPEVEPGTSLKAHAILHDQTGQNIETSVTIKIKDSKDKLKDKIDTTTNETFEFPVLYNEAPQQYKISATSLGLDSETTFNIKEKSNIQVQIVNRTLIIKNTGNVQYCNKTILIKIGNQTLNLDPCLDINKEEKYTLSAPDGNYDVEIITDEKDYKESVMLTGKAIDIQEATAGVVSLTRHPLIWVFVFAILGFVSFNIYKKGFKRSFIGYIHKRKMSSGPSLHPAITIEKARYTSKNQLFPVNEAELCLSIQGEKQTVSMVGLKIKNYRDIKDNLEGVKETFGYISQVAKQYKAVVYENQENTFFIISPSMTKTFKNEMSALEMAQKIKELLIHHNRFFKQKLVFGISLSYGEIIAKQDRGHFEFMGLGDILSQVKKIAGLSNESVLLGEKIKEKFGVEIKTEKSVKDGTPVYTLMEIKDRDKNDKFIKSFLQRNQKRDNQ